MYISGFDSTYNSAYRGAYNGTKDAFRAQEDWNKYKEVLTEYSVYYNKLLDSVRDKEFSLEFRLDNITAYLKDCIYERTYMDFDMWLRDNEIKNDDWLKWLERKTKMYDPVEKAEETRRFNRLTPEQKWAELTKPHLIEF
jgi:hypothetical protein